MKRSEFYAMFITMIVLFTASVSFAVSYQPQVIQPTKPVEALVAASSAATAGTYYTVLNITGTGQLNRMTLNCRIDNPAAQYFTFKFTIDGVASSEFAPPASSELAHTRSLGPNSSTYARNMVIDYLGPIYFKSSLKIEAKISTSSSYPINACLNYALE